MRNETRWKRVFLGGLDFFGLHNLLLIHFVINSIGLITSTMLFATMLAKASQPAIYAYDSFYPWAMPSAGSITKLSSLLQYAFPVAILFGYYAIYFRISKILNNLSVDFNQDRLQQVGFYFLFALVINFCLLFIDKEQRMVLGVLSIIWLIVFLWVPFCIYRNCLLNVLKLALTPMPPRILGGILFIIVLQYISIFAPLIICPLEVSNDYINLSEKTILNSGRVVDNISYINRNGVADLRIYDPRETDDTKQLEKGDLGVEFGRNAANGSIEETSDFIEKNKIELRNQVKAGWFLYHHGYNFGPMNALSLGASPHQLTMVYGWLNTVSQSKVLDFLGMSNYQGYFKLYFAEYIIYFSIFLLGVWAIFKRLDTVLFAAILSISALFFLGIELIRLAPGFNPLRHVFDVPAFYLLYRYLVLDRKGYLISSCALAIIAIFWSKDFGLFLALSIGGAILFKGIKQKPFQIHILFFGLITLVLGVLGYLHPMPGTNPTAIYMLLGVGAPIAPSGKIFGLLIMVSMLLTATILIRHSETYKTLAVAFAFYFVLSLTYYIWYPALHHIYGVAPVFILWITLLFHGWASRTHEGRKRRSFVLILLLVFIYIPSSVIFYMGMYAYNQTFKNHQLYQWPFDMARFLSTTEPSLFEESAELIKRYSKNNNGIFIISKYDHILPILAGKYSAMPYNELPTNLVSPKEVIVASNAVLQHKPNFIFVDSDINRSLNSEIPNESDPVAIKLGLYQEAKARVMVMENLKEVYIRISNKYQLCEAGKLISVYCKKPTANSLNLPD